MSTVFGRVLRTTAATLSLTLRQSEAAGKRRKLMDAITSGAAITDADLNALAAGEVAADLGVIRDMADTLGVSVSALACRSVMERAVHDDEDDEGEGGAPMAGHRFIMSTAAPDREHDIVEQQWKLDDFRRNPVAPWAHNYSLPAVGKWASVGVRGTPAVLRGRLVPDDHETNELGRLVAHQLEAGMLNACSVGFLPSALAPRAAFPEEDPRAGTRGYVLTGNHLLECSPVVVPANAQAVSQERGWVAETIMEAAKGEPADMRALILEALQDPTIRAELAELTADKSIQPPAGALSWLGLSLQ